jgi:hypothetical protein
VKCDQSKDIEIQQIRAGEMNQYLVQYEKEQCQKVSTRSRVSIMDVKELMK